MDAVCGSDMLHAVLATNGRSVMAYEAPKLEIIGTVAELTLEKGSERP